MFMQSLRARTRTSTPHRYSWLLAWPALFLTVSLVGMPSAQAGEKNLQPATMLPSYQKECAGCHLAFPPGMLAPATWSRIMQGLEKHYGTDASLDAVTTTDISTWLQKNGGTYKRVDAHPPGNRITESAWFVREHRKVRAEVWARPSINGPVNCAACHTQAELGNYSERNIRIPKEIDRIVISAKP